MQATQTHSVVRQGSQVAIMSHLKPFSPAMACERRPLSKLPLEARAMIEAFNQLPPKTPTAKLIDAEMQEHWHWHRLAALYRLSRRVPVHHRAAYLERLQALQLSKSQERAMLCYVGKDRGFMKHLDNNFVHSPGSVWTSRYTHRKLGHVLFCNFIHGSWSCRAGIDSNGNSIKYPGWA